MNHKTANVVEFLADVLTLLGLAAIMVVGFGLVVGGATWLYWTVRAWSAERRLRKSLAIWKARRETADGENGVNGEKLDGKGTMTDDQKFPPENITFPEVFGLDDDAMIALYSAMQLGITFMLSKHKEMKDEGKTDEAKLFLKNAAILTGLRDALRTHKVTFTLRKTSGQ